MRLLFTTFFISNLACYSFSQSITNVIAVQQGNNALISYDLNGTPGSSYYVKLFYSTDGGQTFGNELLQVTGDVKSGVKSGIGRRIVWAADKEINYLNSSVIFKVEAESRRIFSKPTTIDNITVDVVRAKRDGENLIVEFTVTQNSEKEILQMSLFRDSQLTVQDGSQLDPSTGKFGTEILNGTAAFNVDCQKGVPAKGILSYKTDESDPVIAAIKFHLYPFGKFVVKNIPIQ